MAAPRRTQDRTATRSSTSGSAGHSVAAWQNTLAVRGQVSRALSTTPSTPGAAESDRAARSQIGVSGYHELGPRHHRTVWRRSRVFRSDSLGRRSVRFPVSGAVRPDRRAICARTAGDSGHPYHIWSMHECPRRRPQDPALDIEAFEARLRRNGRIRTLGVDVSAVTLALEFPTRMGPPLVWVLGAVVIATAWIPRLLRSGPSADESGEHRSGGRAPMESRIGINGPRCHSLLWPCIHSQSAHVSRCFWSGGGLTLPPLGGFPVLAIPAVPFAAWVVRYTRPRR